MNSLEHIAFACDRAQLKNCFMIEADFNNFPEPKEVVIEKPWMRNAFEFSEYSDPHVQLFTCNHNCKDKKRCLHPCCKGLSRTTVNVTVKFRDGSSSVESISLIEGAQEPDQLGELENGGFWDSPTRVQYHQPVAETRISSQLRKKDFDYDFEYEDDVDHDSADDYSNFSG